MIKKYKKLNYLDTSLQQKEGNININSIKDI